MCAEDQLQSEKHVKRDMGRKGLEGLGSCKVDAAISAYMYTKCQHMQAQDGCFVLDSGMLYSHHRAAAKH